jgi:hypothetical protein
MANVSVSGGTSSKVLSPPKARGRKLLRFHVSPRRLLFTAAAVLLSPLLFSQSAPQINGVAPPSGKVNDTVTISGQNLGKDAVSAVYLSDDKDDYRATVVEQGAEKIIVKVPKVKSGNYNISIQVGDKLFIKPIRFKVEE